MAELEGDEVAWVLDEMALADVADADSRMEAVDGKEQELLLKIDAI